jgi:hypothetical protein
MTRPFTPPPDVLRCCAVTFCGISRARCPARRAPGSDVCEEHKDAEGKGRWIVRVKPARRIA